MKSSSLRKFIHRYGARRVIVVLTLLSILFSLVITTTILYLSGNRQVAEFKTGILIAIIAPTLIGPILTYAFFRLLEQLDRSEAERAQTVAELEEALDAIRVLRGLLPICAACKMIRDDQGYWAQIEEYLHEHADIDFTHSFCPDCADALYREFVESDKPD